MGDDQSLRFGRERHLRRFLRRRVAGVAGALALLLAEGRLVDQEIGSLRRIDRRGTGPRIAADCHQAPRPRGADKIGRLERWTVGKCDRLALCQLAPQRSFGDARRLGLLDVEASAAHVLLQYVAERRATAMLSGKRADVVPVSFPDRITCLHFIDFDWERYSLDSQLHGRSENLLRPFGAVEKQRLRPPLQSEGPDQSNDAKEVIGVKMREE